MKLYNTLTNSINRTIFKNKKIQIYSCGPTVYDYIHIGNARTLIIVDLLIHLLEFNKNKVFYIQNFTDIDDKIIDKAIKKNKHENQISEFYIKMFYKDISSLNLRLPNKNIKISDYIQEIIQFINNLVKKNDAYIIDGNVYFNINKYKKKYGILSNVNINKLITNDEFKKNNLLDFVLWKKTTHGVTFLSPWGLGRPGWHTECSALIDIFFNNQTIDIHVGGIDLIFPHHENERIQYFAKNKKEIAKLWIHNGYVIWNNKKMSKSINNVITLRKYLKQYGANSLKYLFYSINYRKPININKDIIKYSVLKINKIFNILKKINIYIIQKKIILNFNKKGQYLKQICKELNNNLNTIKVLNILNKLIKIINIKLKTKNISLILISDLYIIINDLLNFNFKLPIITLNILNLLNKWEIYKKNKKFKQADILRKKLLQLNIL